MTGVLMLKVALLAMLILSNPVLAADWIPIMRISKDTMQVYVETESVLRQGDSVRVWLRTVVDKPPPNKPPITIQESTWFKCSTMESALVSVFMYIGTDDTGELLQSEKWPFSPDRFSPIRPGTDKELIAKYICAKPTKTF